MHSDRFDDLARALARGLTRRQVIQGIAMGAGAHLLSSLGLGRGPLASATAYAAGDIETFLPVIRAPGTPIGGFISICAVSSTCDNKQYCAERSGCLCVQSAEGDMRCGVPPSCGVQKCTTSADCANLGEGYFCDTPDSGCCDQGKEEKFQRCLAPCPNPLPCPEERLCGDSCCEANAICQNGVCVDLTTGTWTGTATFEQQSIGIRFIIDHRGGDIQGRMLLQDPVTGQYLETGTIDGRRTGDYATWDTEGNSQVYGDYTDPTHFAGWIFFPARHDEDGFEAELTLQRDS